jgi:peptidoglycan/xylan/chitin deacetylase (PgdA/CDA1 family)
MFEEHMAWIRSSCNVIRFSQVLDHLIGGDTTRPRVAVTFDDGYADNYTQALPILLRHEIPATFFLATGLIERKLDVLMARSWRGWREENSTLTWRQILHMRRLGMAIGAHGHSHKPLMHLTDDAVVADLAECKRLLEARLAEPILSLAYPKGRPRRDFSLRTVQLARDAGFRRAAAVLLRGVRRSDDVMAVPRFPIAGDTLGLLQAKVEGRLDLLGSLQERVPPVMLELISREGH